MTITYTLKVSNSRLCGFSKLLFHWKGSVYKLVYKEMCIFLVLYYALSCIYRFALNDPQKRIFETVVIYFQSFLDLIPLTFLLGFYVAMVVGRWWNQYLSIPWPDRLMGYVSTLVNGSDERGRLIRRTMMRWLNLSHVMVMQSISIVVKKRFPTTQHLVDAGLMTNQEKRKIENIPTSHNMFWVPTIWFSTLLSQCLEEGRIRDEIHLKTLLDEVTAFKGSLGMLYSYDWISIPLVYTQVTTMAVYGFFFACLMGRQYIENSPADPAIRRADLYVPLFTLMQFFFYMGWLKVAEVLINPFGEDEDDFETNWIIDRNYQIAMLGVDELYEDLPVLEKDIYWDDLEPELPYTKSTICHKNDPFMGSTADFSMDPEDIGSQVFTQMETIQENVGPPSKQHLDLPPSAAPSALSSPSRFRHLISNISSAFSNESISDSRYKDVEASSVHNVKEIVRDPMLYQSPLLQRVKSTSVKRSLSHTEHLMPQRRGSMSHVDVMTCGSMGQPLLNFISSPVPNGHSRVHANRPSHPANILLKSDAQRSHSSTGTLAFTSKDTPVVGECHPKTSPSIAGGPCDPSGDFYKKPEPPETPSALNSPNVNHHVSGVAPSESQWTVYTNDNNLHPNRHYLTGNSGTDQNGKVIGNQRASLHNPPVHISDSQENGNRQSAVPQGLMYNTNAPVNHILTANGSDQPPATFPNYNSLESPDYTHCNSMWSQNGSNLSSTASPINSASTTINASTPSVLPCDSSVLPEQAVPRVHWDLDKDKQHASSTVPQEASSGDTKSDSTLVEGKANSQDSIDSTYDSSYDTVNSQEPLLKSSGHWKENV